MMHPACELRWVNDVIGYGVFARELIPRGTITWARDPLDQVLTAEQVAALPEVARTKVEFFSYIDPHGGWVLCWDLGKYVNHSCAPTSRGLGDDAEFALRDIRPGEHMTSDYAELNILTGFTCRCGAPECRGGVSADDLPRYFESWDAAVAEALPFITRVAQPLWPLVQGPDRIIAAAEGRAQLASRIDYRFQNSAR